MAAERDWLLIRGPGGEERRVALAEAVVRIGRAPGNQVVVSDEFVSGTHVEIVERDGRRWVQDLGSTNGTELNERELAVGRSVPLRDGDVIRLGSYSLLYRTGSAVFAPERESRGASPDPDFGLPPEPSRRRRGFAGALLRFAILAGLPVIVVAGLLWMIAPPRVGLLVLGSDARPDEVRRGEVGRTDTLMAVVADRPPGGAAVVSLPRDLWVGITGYGEERINAAYALGGAAAAKRAAGDVLGVPIGRYLLIGLQGVREIVDAAGGVEIDVPFPIRDDAYPTDDYGTIVVEIRAGRQRMDGETALRYARTRHQDSDFGRIARQQQVLVALRNAMLRPTSWWRAPAVLEATRRAVRTDLGPLDLTVLAVAFVAEPGEPQRLAVGPGLVEPFSGTEGAYLLRPTPLLRRTVAVLLSPSEARVEVLNGTATAGLAARTAETLRGRGLASVRSGDATQLERTTRIEVRPGLERSGRHVAAITGLSAEVVRDNPGLPEDVDVRVILGER